MKPSISRWPEDRSVVIRSGNGIGARIAVGVGVSTGSHSSAKLKEPDPGRVRIWLGSIVDTKPPSKTMRPAGLVGEGHRGGVGPGLGDQAPGQSSD